MISYISWKKVGSIRESMSPKNVKLPDDSRGLQNIQHIVGGTHNILLVLVGVYFGKDNTSLGILMAGLTFLVSRLSSEISYQTSIKVVKEYSNNKNN
ncbi:MAG: hypothetical protein C3F06_14220 [Candidatus Methanoperedenaceae archaeon]|nr:MAG: hypothetical protein C3F06_14220 [Candidatus Methanoperedenaceae archaeon]